MTRPDGSDGSLLQGILWSFAITLAVIGIIYGAVWLVKGR